MQKYFVFILLLLVGCQVESTVAEKYCYNKVLQDCSCGVPHVSCNANYGHFTCLEPMFNDLFNNYLMRSFEFLLLSTNFDNYEFARPGFSNFFDQLSDHSWESALRLIFHITNRDGIVKFAHGNAYTIGKYDIHELDALAMAVDAIKQFEIDVNEIYSEATITPAKHDMAVKWLLEDRFAVHLSKRVRQVVGYVTETTKMSDTTNYAVALTLFDDYLLEESV